MARIYRYVLKPDKEQKQVFKALLADHCWLYNRLLCEKNRLYREEGKVLSRYDLAKLIPTFRAERPSLSSCYSATLQQVAFRLDKDFQVFFSLRKRGKWAEPVTAIAERDYLSIVFPQHGAGIWLEGESLRVSKIGVIPVSIVNRPENTIKSCTVGLTDSGTHFAEFYTEVDTNPRKLSERREEYNVPVALEDFFER